MTTSDVRLALLHAELLRDWKAVEEHLERGRSVDPSQGDANAALVALSLDHAYQAFEAILLRVERNLSLPERRGESWHRALLGDGALSLEGVRPPLYPAVAERDWEELLRFRHFLRHAYHVQLDATRLAANVLRLDRAVAATEPVVRVLIAALVVPDNEG